MSRYFALTLSLVAVASASIWPAPQTMTQGNKTVWLSQTIKVTYNGDFMPYTYKYIPYGPNYTSKEIVQGGVSRSLGQIFDDYFVPWMLHTRDERDSFEPDVYGEKVWVSSLAITQTGQDTADTFRAPAGEVDESYNLTMSETGEATIQAVSALGVLQGLQSFNQLFYRHSGGPFWYSPIAPVAIEDYPEYPHRGILLDVSRHWYPMEDIMRTIDALAWNKMNRLHIHATDSQAWPLDIPSLPEVAEKGAYHPHQIYSAADQRAIQEHGTRQGVQVIIEIDMPGHIGVLGESHPELVVAYDERPYYWYCAQPPCGALRLNNSDVDDFLETLFDDLLPRVSPYTSYFHTGGDELNANDSTLDPGVGTNDEDVLRPLLQEFIDTQHQRVFDAGLIPLVWEEIPLDWGVELQDEVVVQSWLGTVSNITALGHKVIDSNYNFWYLDCGRGQWLTFDNEAFDQFYPFNDWCGPTKSWALIYSHDPREGLSEEEAQLVLGGEVAVWSETIDSTNMDTLIWPRACAAGEVLWSGRKDPKTGENRDQRDAAPRLAEMRERLVKRGVRASPFWQEWCTMMSSDPLACTYDVSP